MKARGTPTMEIPDTLFYAIQVLERFEEGKLEPYETLRSEIEVLKAAIRDLHKAPERPHATCLGYIKMDRSGDQRPGVLCVGCGKRIWGPVWAGLMSDGSTSAPLCDLCAKPK